MLKSGWPNETDGPIYPYGSYSYMLLITVNTSWSYCNMSALSVEPFSNYPRMMSGWPKSPVGAPYPHSPSNYMSLITVYTSRILWIFQLNWESRFKDIVGTLMHTYRYSWLTPERVVAKLILPERVVSLCKMTEHVVVILKTVKDDHNAFWQSRVVHNALWSI